MEGVWVETPCSPSWCAMGICAMGYEGFNCNTSREIGTPYRASLKILPLRCHQAIRLFSIPPTAVLVYDCNLNALSSFPIVTLHDYSEASHLLICCGDLVPVLHFH